MSLVPEVWTTIGTAKDGAGHAVVYVGRRKLDFEERCTIWKLVLFPGRGWRSVGQFISKGLYRPFPERYGVVLTDSRIDQILLEHAQAAHG